MNPATATMTVLDHDCVGKTPAQILARYQQRIYEFRASYSNRAENVIMHGEHPQLVELREGDDLIGPRLFIAHGYRALTRARLLWCVRSRSTPGSRTGRSWHLEVDEVDTIRGYLEAVARRIKPATSTV